MVQEVDPLAARPPTIGQCATLACLLEVSVPKPGNVHRGADFEDVGFLDFAVSAAAIGPAFDAAVANGVGRTVLDAVAATRALVASNTNLGMVLLLAPLAAVPRDEPLADGVARVLANLTADDAERVYAAIRLAQPGGMGHVAEMDVADAPPPDLVSAMRSAADRDLVARQYAVNFADVLDFVVPSLVEGCRTGWPLSTSIVHTHLRVMSRFSDSLIARKCGREVAESAAARAGAVLAAGQPDDDTYLEGLADLDFWLRSDGHRRNPGTTADLLTAGLFAALRDGLLAPPFR